MSELEEINDDWLSKFYSSKNQVTNDQDWTELISLWEEFYTKDGFPICFFFQNSPCNVNFYFGSKTVKGANSLRHELLSFFDHYHIKFTGTHYDLDKGLTHEKLLSQVIVNPCFKINSEDKVIINILKNDIKTYGKLLNQRPEITRKIKLPFGQIRDLFDKAILCGDYKRAYKYKDELINNASDGRLTPQHELYLNIRLIAGLGFWDRLNTNDLRKLIDFKNQLPVSIIRDITDYFFSVGVSSFLNTDDVDGCLKQLDSYKFKEFLGFFSQKKLINNKKSLIIFLFSEIAQEKINIEYALSICTEIYKSENPLIVRTIEKTYLSKNNFQNMDFFKEGKRCFLDEEYDKALFNFFKIKPSSSSLIYIIRCMISKFLMKQVHEWPDVEGYDASLIKNILNYYSNLSNEEKVIFDQNENSTFIKEFYKLDEGFEGSKEDFDNIIDEWDNWLSSVQVSKNIEEEISFFNNYVNDWDIRKFKNNPKSLNEYLDNLLTIDQTLFLKTYKKFYDKFFIENDLEDKEFIDFFISFINYLVLAENFDENDLQICFSIQEHILQLGLSNVQYKELIEALLIVISPQRIGLNNFDLMLDISETFSFFPKRDENSSVIFQSKILEIGVKNIKRLNQNQKLCLRALCNDFGEVPEWLRKNEIEEKKENEFYLDSFSHLKEKKLGIYTLNENAGKRIKKILNEKVPSCKIDLNSDKECTDRLKAISSNSDVFVFSWKCSKHQAYYCIKNNRASDLPFLQPLGKGSASILNELIKLK